VNQVRSQKKANLLSSIQTLDPKESVGIIASAVEIEIEIDIEGTGE
jgi:hypothetical protein